MIPSALRVNAAETKAAQKANLEGAVLLPEDDGLPPAEALQNRRRRFQNVIAHAISGGVYAGKHITSVVSHPGVPYSDIYTPEFRHHVRIVLDGSKQDIPIARRLQIVNVLAYQKLHQATGYFDFQLRCTACKDSLGRLCDNTDYPTLACAKYISM